MPPSYSVLHYLLIVSYIVAIASLGWTIRGGIRLAPKLILLALDPELMLILLALELILLAHKLT